MDESMARFLLKTATDETNLAFKARDEGSSARYAFHMGLGHAALAEANRLLKFRVSA